MRYTKGGRAADLSQDGHATLRHSPNRRAREQKAARRGSFDYVQSAALVTHGQVLYATCACHSNPWQCVVPDEAADQALRPSKETRVRLPSCLISILLLACSSAATSPDEVRVLGAIAGYNADDPRIDIVTAPGSATVRVTTYGGGCHTKGETEVLLRRREAVITPYDYTAPAGTICTLQLVWFSHETTIDFESSGPARIVVRGADHRQRGTITVERAVVIP